MASSPVVLVEPAPPSLTFGMQAVVLVDHCSEFPLKFSEFVKQRWHGDGHSVNRNI